MLAGPCDGRLLSPSVNTGRILGQINHGATSVAMSPNILLTGKYAANVKHTKLDNGVHLLENLRIFKAGTFADSMGFVRTWETHHLDLMVLHYRLLKEGGFLPNVPIRADHSISVKDVVGYFTDVYRDAEDDNFLSASIEITEQDAYDKWERGTYRSRSLEVGFYETNDGSGYYPVIVGLAFVDLPAVEGLDHGRPRNKNSFSLFVMDKETDVSGTPAPTPTPTPAPEPTPAPAAHAAPSILPTPPAPAPAAPTPSPVPMQTFRVNGTDTADHAAVQTHITALETFARETMETNRKEFVTAMAHANKIPASSIDSMQALVLTMSPTQFEAWRAAYDAAPPAPGFSAHGQQPSNQPASQGAPGAPGVPPAEPTEIETLEEIIAQHKRAGTPQDKIEKTASFKRLQVLRAAPKP